MKVKIFLACMALCSSVNAATVSGSIAYSFKGMSGVVPFSMSEGQEVTINDTFKTTPYVKSITNGKETPDVITEGGEFKLRINSLSKDSVMASYTLKLNRLEDMRHVAGIDLPTSREVFNKGKKQAIKGERTNVFQSENAVVSIVVN